MWFNGLARTNFGLFVVIIIFEVIVKVCSLKLLCKLSDKANEKGDL